MKILATAFLSTALSLLSFHVYAEVLDKTASSFQIEVRADVDRTPEVVYQQFLEIDEWWDADHSWFGSADNFYIEPKAGGCFCEVDGDRQVQHMTVSYVEPNKEVRLLGGLGPLQMMAVSGAMSWVFDEQENGKTTIIHRYTVTGYFDGGLDKLAPIVDQVQASQVARLVKQLSVKAK